jgi:membrane-bound metal-dependent hydrolase YbcI (DUF457 family)
MDILTHTLSGVAVGSCLALARGSSWRKKTAILFFSGLGGALPDVDAISLWSQFDGTIGRFFHLSYPGKDIYSGNFWYSHRGFMHSLSAAVGITCFIGLVLFLISQIKQKKNRSLFQSFEKKQFVLWGFFLGFIIHLLEDIVTPGGSWGGIRLFFPSEIYIGGTGDVWWWNNYDVFLIVTSVLVVIFILLFFSCFFTFSSLARKLGFFIFTLGLIFATIQIKTRNYNFNNKPFEACEKKSNVIQQELLGKELYHMMERFDRWLPIYF